MSMKVTYKSIKKFSKEEKLAILEEGKRNGIKMTLAKYSLFPETYYYWRKKFNVSGDEGLTHQVVIDHASLIRKLETENKELKLLLARNKLESRLKDDLLKKSIQNCEGGINDTVHGLRYAMRPISFSLHRYQNNPYTSL